MSVNRADHVDVSIVLPCLNEEESVGGCVQQARRACEEAGLSHEVIVCDNGSTDASAVLAERAGAVVVKEARRGYGWAVAKAISASRGEVLLISDADGTYPLDRAPELVARVRESGTLVLGSRFNGRILPGSMPALHRLIGNPGTRVLLRLLFGVRCSDPHTGMRAMTRRTFGVVQPSNREFEYTIQMVMNATRKGVCIEEIPITYGSRVGHSKLRALPEGWSLLRFLLLNSPTFLYLIPGLTAMALGAAGMTWLATGDKTVGRATLSGNSMLVASLLLVTGYQIVTFGTCARAYNIGGSRGRRAAEGLFQRLFGLERGLLAGALVLAAGLVLVVTVGVRWLSTSFGAVTSSEHRQALIGLTAAVLGMQTIFSSFFLSLFLHGRPVWLEEGAEPDREPAR